MRLSRAAYPALAASCLLALLSACGSSKSSNVNGDGSGGSANTGATSSIAGTPNLGLGGSAINDNSAGSGGIDKCAGNLIQAERIPLDMYVMLDVSGSMLEPTAGDANVTKWQAVSSALTDFVSDKASAGIGVGLQVFPIAHADAPTMCTTDKGCATYGPCVNRGCWPPLNGQLDPCFVNADCGVKQNCVVVGECSRDTTYGCDHDFSDVCGAGLGDCVVPPSICLTAADCRPATYAAPAADIAALPSAQANLVRVIAAAAPDPGNLTPTGPALLGAIQESKTWAQAHTDHQVVAVLATDGSPTLQAKGQSCELVSQVADIQAVIDLAGSGRTTAPLISTFVIGVLSPDDVTSGAPDILNAIAMSGGTSTAFIVDTTGNVQAGFRDALNQIRKAGLSCDLLVPKPEAGKTLDFGQVNVSFDDGTGAKTLDNVADASGCAKDPMSWYYDVDPAQGTPTKISTCPATCTAFQKTDMGSVQIELGCKTRQVVK